MRFTNVAGPPVVGVSESGPALVLQSTGVPFTSTGEADGDESVASRPDDDDVHVVELAAGRWAAGTHRVTWDGRDAAGRSVASGAYVVRLQAGQRVAVRKVLLAR